MSFPLYVRALSRFGPSASLAPSRSRSLSSTPLAPAHGAEPVFTLFGHVQRHCLPASLMSPPRGHGSFRGAESGRCSWPNSCRMVLYVRGLLYHYSL